MEFAFSTLYLPLSYCPAAPYFIFFVLELHLCLEMQVLNVSHRETGCFSQRRRALFTRCAGYPY